MVAVGNKKNSFHNQSAKENIYIFERVKFSFFINHPDRPSLYSVSSPHSFIQLSTHIFHTLGIFVFFYAQIKISILTKNTAEGTRKGHLINSVVRALCILQALLPYPYGFFNCVLKCSWLESM